ncbi:MAG: tetratricopeptide repeat protein [Planctomycetota bacterium]|jgi:tetratricopeptide (TPR) repeat protein|nr:tetratricopeptide repeat protein [Planctomycetota bacterium]MDP7251029.1 tetratricopeptide repeat protein [Planctomycetota bacterium]
MPLNDQDQISRLNEQVLQLYHQGQYDSASTFAEQARDLARMSIGEETVGYAHTVENLGEIHRAMGNAVSAESLLKEALIIKQRVLGESHLEYANTLNNLAGAYKTMGDYAQAEPLYKQAIAIREECLNERAPLVATTLNNLADLYREMGRYHAAEPLHKRAQKIFLNTLGEFHPDYAVSLNNLALLYKSMGRYYEAEPLYEKVIEIDRQVLGENHPDYATDLNNLAELYHYVGKYREAGPLYYLAAEIRRAVLGENHPDYASSLNNLAALYAATGRESQALTLLEKSARIDNQIIQQVFAIESESQRIAFLKTFQGKQDLYVSLVTRYFSQTSAAVRQAFTLIKGRKLVQVDARASKQDIVLGLKYPDLKTKLQQLQTLRMQNVEGTMKGKLPPEAQNDLENLKHKMEQEIAEQAPELDAQTARKHSEFEVISKAIPMDFQLLDYVRYNEFDFEAVPADGRPRWKPARYLAFVTPNGESEEIRIIDLGDAAEIDRQISSSH